MYLAALASSRAASASVEEQACSQVADFHWAVSAWFVPADFRPDVSHRALCWVGLASQASVAARVADRFPGDYWVPMQDGWPEEDEVGADDS